MLTSELISNIDFAKSGGLISAVVQCVDSARVLMVGYVNAEALAVTLTTKRVTFFSRSKNRLWTKGESSGHFLQLVDAAIDCDRDAVLFTARALGPTCHNGTTSCFDGAFDRSAGSALSFLSDLDQLILDRKNALPEGSYTTKLFTGELRRIAQKVGEEGVETALAATLQNDEALLGEAGDLIFHLLVLLRARNLSLQDVIELLKSRHGKVSAK
jgi:phosphoribosyl-AMP cyclohydrolase / phosphoribosyl-ATP pyrophosphohydrolase